VSNPSSGRFHKLVLNEVPESIREMIAHNVAAIAELTGPLGPLLRNRVLGSNEAEK
jgi:hypothetical protein